MLEKMPSRTAEAVCLMRAYEHAKPAVDRVLDDPYARWFLRPLARAALATSDAGRDIQRYAEWATDGLVRFVIARHRYIDDALAQALRGRVQQVVVLGAGYDMRAYRFAAALRGRPLYEVDHPHQPTLVKHQHKLILILKVRANEALKKKLGVYLLIFLIL